MARTKKSTKRISPWFRSLWTPGKETFPGFTRTKTPTLGGPNANTWWTKRYHAAGGRSWVKVWRSGKDRIRLEDTQMVGTFFGWHDSNLPIQSGCQEEWDNFELISKNCQSFSTEMKLQKDQCRWLESVSIPVFIKGFQAVTLRGIVSFRYSLWLRWDIWIVVCVCVSFMHWKLIECLWTWLQAVLSQKDTSSIIKHNTRDLG